MARTTRIIASTTVLLIGLLLPHSVQAAGSEPGTPKTPIENTYTDAEQTLIDWATHRFVSAGLTPPSAVFVFHSSSIDCYGHVGLYYPQSNTVHMCRLERHSILHELAHAWVQENLTSTTKAAFVTSRYALGAARHGARGRDHRLGATGPQPPGALGRRRRCGELSALDHSRQRPCRAGKRLRTVDGRAASRALARRSPPPGIADFG